MIAQPVVLSSLHVQPLLAARQKGLASASLSLDLGLTTVQLPLYADHVPLPGGLLLDWSSIETIHETSNVCFVVAASGIEKIQRFSQETRRFCSLMPTAGAPTLLLAGFPMHRIKDIDPHEDTRRKIKAVAPVRGRVLDCTTGLGYTAIAASQTADEVITIELDPAVLEVARLNPWSRGLFENTNITQLVGDTFEAVQEFRDGYFSHIIHDPPTFSLAGELYSATFYRDLFRILRRGGRLFHYVGDLKSGFGQRVVKGVVRRLHEAGFGRVRPFPQAFGVVAYR